MPPADNFGKKEWILTACKDPADSRAKTENPGTPCGYRDVQEEKYGLKVYKIHKKYREDFRRRARIIPYVANAAVQPKEEIPMVKVLASKEGTGKTKRLIEMANERLNQTSGNVVFIDDDKKHIYQLKHDLRFISMDEYPIHSQDEFVGFVCGLISNNFDIRDIFIDGLTKVMELSPDGIPKLITKLDTISTNFDVDFTVTLTCEPHLVPESVQPFLVE